MKKKKNKEKDTRKQKNEKKEKDYMIAHRRDCFLKLSVCQNIYY